MKIKSIFLSVLILVTVLIAGCGKDPVVQVTDNEAILKEMKACFEFFYNEAQTDKNSPAYGLIADRYPNTSNMGSIASVGFGLPAIIIGIEKGWITREAGLERVNGTLNTFKNFYNLNGFYYHFINMNTALRFGTSEISAIDTAIFICGALFAGAYFGGETETLANLLYDRIDWSWYVGKNGTKDQFRMGYQPETGFEGFWDYYAEQLILYVLGAGANNEDYRTGKDVYDGFLKKKGTYNDYNYIYSFFGALFTYQFSHAFIDFRNIKDANGVNWYDNSVAASNAAYEFCVDNQNLVATYSPTSWGLTACDTKFGYGGHLGTPPRGWVPGGTDLTDFNKMKGTIAPSAALGSIAFTPEISIKSLKHYQSITALNGKYGLLDSYDLVNNWYAGDCVGINKGNTILMLANYENDFIWEIFNEIDIIKNGLTNIGFTNG